MRSNELARLAGVTVRTLRHYHQIGLLPEPQRSSNGYRTYGAADLATVLRIVSFTDLGIPLSEIARVLDDDEASAKLLDGIDQQAGEEIERLSARRRTIAELRTNGASPDLPRELARYATFFTSQQGATAEQRTHLREQLALVYHFFKGTGISWLSDAFDRLAGLNVRYAELITRFDALSDDTPIDEQRAFAQQFAELLIAALPLGETPIVSAEASALLREHQNHHYNDAQSFVSDEIGRIVSESSL